MRYRGRQLNRMVKISDGVVRALSATALPVVEDGASSALKSPNPAERAVEHIKEEITAFEANLSNDEEVGGIIIGAPGGTVFHIVKFYVLNMDILVFVGVNEHGKPQRLIQHITQLSILLTALPKIGITPRRIGFQAQEPPAD